MRVEVLNHQMTIDYLNESFQTEANVDLTSIDYMEKIKQINIDWIRIKSLISARIDVSVETGASRSCHDSFLDPGTTE